VKGKIEHLALLLIPGARESRVSGKRGLSKREEGR